MARRHGRGFQKVIDNVRWSGGAATFLAQSAGSVAATLITASSEEDTVLRLRGEILCWLDSTQAPGVAIDVGIGLITRAGGSSTTVRSNPITDADAPWLMYERFTLAYEEAVTDVIAAQVCMAKRITVDVKAMRKLRPDQEMQVVLEQATIGSAGSINCSLTMRALLGD